MPIIRFPQSTSNMFPTDAAPAALIPGDGRDHLDGRVDLQYRAGRGMGLGERVVNDGLESQMGASIDLRGKGYAIYYLYTTGADVCKNGFTNCSCSLPVLENIILIMISTACR